jgi:hypothetical protein
MGDVTRIFGAVDHGNHRAAEDLVCDELLSLAAQRLSHEEPGQILRPQPSCMSRTFGCLDHITIRSGTIATSSSPLSPSPRGGSWSRTRPP